jgi:hypothetical protein
VPPKTEIKHRTLHDLNRAVEKTVKTASTAEEIDAVWQTLHGPARDGLSLTYWRMLIAEKRADREKL